MPLAIIAIAGAVVMTAALVLAITKRPYRWALRLGLVLNAVVIALWYLGVPW
jgi:hypothetical protein